MALESQFEKGSNQVRVRVEFESGYFVSKESTSADGLDPQWYGLAQVWGRELVGARAQVAVLYPSSTVKVSNKG